MKLSWEEKPTVFDPILHHQFSPLFARFPPWSDNSPRGLPTKLSQLLVRLVHNGVLLLQVHLRWVLVRISMQPTIPQQSAFTTRDSHRLCVHLMTRITNHPTLFPESVERVPWDEPCRLDLVFVEKLEETTDAHGASKDPCNPSQCEYCSKKTRAYLGICHSWSLRRHMSLATRQRRQCPQRCKQGHLRS